MQEITFDGYKGLILLSAVNESSITIFFKQLSELL